MKRALFIEISNLKISFFKKAVMLGSLTLALQKYNHRAIFPWSSNRAELRDIWLLKYFVKCLIPFLLISLLLASSFISLSLDTGLMMGKTVKKSDKTFSLIKQPFYKNSSPKDSAKIFFPLLMVCFKEIQNKGLVITDLSK